MMHAAIPAIRSFWTRSIRRQLMLGIALVHAVLMTIFIVDLVERQRDFLHDQGITQTKSLAETLAANSTSWLLSNDVIGLEEVVQSQAKYPGVQYAMVLNPQGRVLGHTDSSRIGLYIADDISLSLIKGKPEAQILADTSNLADIAEPILANGQYIGWARVGIDRNAVNASLDLVTRDGVIYTFLAIVVGTLFAFFMANGLTSGLQHIVDVTEQVRRGVKGKRTDLDREDELGVLARTFNAMADTIQTREQDLEDARDGLEGTVLERTRELRQEIKDRKTFEFALKESEAKTRQIVNSAVDGIITLDEKGIILSYNAAAEKMFGYSVIEAIGQNVKLLMPSDVASQHDQYLQKYRETGHAKIIGIGREVVARRKDGSTFLMDLSVSEFRHGDGVVFVGIVRDITKRKEAEYQLNTALEDLQKSQAEIELSEKRLRDILDSSTSGISVLRSNPTTRAYSNNRLLEMFGAQSLEELNAIGVEATFINHDDYVVAKKFIDHGEGFEHLTMKRKRLDGTTWWALQDARPIEFEGESAIIIWHYDITDQKDAEEGLIEAEKMASLGGLVAGVAHEINTPIGVGLMAVTHLKEQADKVAQKLADGQLKKSDLNAFVETSIQSTSMITANLDRASDLVRSFKQVAVDQTSEVSRQINLLDYVDEVLESLKPNLRNTQHKITVAGDRDIQIETHPGALAQVITNLLMNSVTHAYDEGEMGHINIGVQKNGTSLSLLYSDDGKGMEEDVQAKIFEPFFTTKRGSGGSGLGMHILFNQVTQTLGGKIDLHSAPGEGSEFNITIPYKADHIQAGEQQ